MKHLGKAPSVNSNNWCVYLVNKTPRYTHLGFNLTISEPSEQINSARPLNKQSYQFFTPVGLLRQHLLITIERIRGKDHTALQDQHSSVGLVAVNVITG